MRLPVKTSVIISLTVIGLTCRLSSAQTNTVSELAENKLKVVTSYLMQDNVVNTVFQSTDSEFSEFILEAIRDVETNGPVEAWWINPQQFKLEGANWQCIGLKFSGEDIPKKLIYDLNIGDEKTSITADIENPSLVVTYGAFDSEKSNVQLYIENKGDQAYRVDSIDLNGKTLSIPEDHLPALKSGEKAFFMAQVDFLNIMNVYESVLVSLHHEDVEDIQIVPLFPQRPVALARDNSLDYMLQCPTHNHGTKKEATTKIVDLAGRTAPQDRVLHICRASFEEGLSIYGRMSEQVSLTPLNTNPETGTENWLSGLLDVCDDIKRQIEPGVCRVVIDDRSQLPNSSNNDMAIQELREVVYAQIACGAKQITFREEAFERPQQLRAIEHLKSELDSLSELISFSDTIDLNIKATDENVMCRALLCGDRGILLFALQAKTHSDENSEPFDILLSEPSGMKFKSFFEIGGQNESGKLSEVSEGVQLQNVSPAGVGIYFLTNENS